MPPALLAETAPTDATAARIAGATHAEETIRFTTAAVRVAFTWFGTSRAVSDTQRRTIADSFDAREDSIRAGKKLINTKHPSYRALTAIRSEILNDWRTSSLPFPEPGIRLIRQTSVDAFQSRMESHRSRLISAVVDLQDAYPEIREEARIRLGSLYNHDDYPTTLDGIFSVSWEYPSVEPPDYLLHLRPELYEQERARVAAQFAQAVTLAEQEFTQQFAEAITALCERLGRDADGQPRVFRDSAVGNLTDFFERFRELNVGSNPELDGLVSRAQEIVSGAGPNRLRTNTNLRETIATQLSAVGEHLTEMIVDRPRRRILRGPATPPTPEPTPDPETEL